jgi:hypothetical protein
MPDERSQRALAVSEQYAEGLVGRRVLAAARRAAYEATRASDLPPGVARNYYPATSHAANVALYAADGPDKYEASELARITAGTASSLLWHLHRGSADSDEKVAQTHVLRDVLGNPFRPVTIDPAWLTSTVVALASGIYDERAFDRLPILADALQDAGCDSADILTHCRGDGPHVRGCWVVDLILGKE